VTGTAARSGPLDEHGLPRGLRPMLASSGALPDPASARASWAFEMKWDGLRAVAYIGGGSLRLVSRTGRDITHAYPDLAGLAGAVRAAGATSAVLDGEIVAPDPAAPDLGVPSFEALQQRMNISSADDVRILAARIPVTYVAFDLLSLNGHALLDLPCAERRGLLGELRLDGPRWQSPPALAGLAGADALAASVQRGLEGVVAKRLASRYEPGRRSSSWVKAKNIRRQEAVVGGWQPGAGGRSGQIGSLLVGVYDAGGLAYAGHVGTGFTQQVLDQLAARLAPLRQGASPFATPVPPEHARHAVWAAPRLVVEVAFTQWTSAGRLRGPSYKGLRDDKDPRDVVRET
jgi:bifunctional non-homologous end joining protein LigD